MGPLSPSYSPQEREEGEGATLNTPLPSELGRERSCHLLREHTVSRQEPDGKLVHRHGVGTCTTRCTNNKALQKAFLGQLQQRKQCEAGQKGFRENLA